MAVFPGCQKQGSFHCKNRVYKTEASWEKKSFKNSGLGRQEKPVLQEGTLGIELIISKNQAKSARVADMLRHPFPVPHRDRNQPDCQRIDRDW